MPARWPRLKSLPAIWSELTSGLLLLFFKPAPLPKHIALVRKRYISRLECGSGVCYVYLYAIH
jgi:hypothetical protein